MKKVFYSEECNFQCIRSQFEDTVNTNAAVAKNASTVIAKFAHFVKSSAKSTSAKLACLVAFSLVLSACSLLPAKKSHTAAKLPVTSSTSADSGSTTSNTSHGVVGSPLASQAYVGNKQAASQGIVIASTRNACVDGFNFLKGMNQNQFGLYSEDYNRINQNYTFLNINKEIMDKDSKEVLSMTLNKKLDTLCTKVQYAGFIGVKDRIKELNAH